ncbi:MAG: WD40/YVTN/BNR-like repeat-containing protein [Chloroflexota bacterium]
MTGGAAPEVLSGPPIPLHGGQLATTVDGGRHWISLSPPVAAQSVCFGDPKQGWLASGPTVWHTTDGGHSWDFDWQAPVDPRMDWAAQVHCAGPATAWVLFTGSAVAMNHKPYLLDATTDTGAHWMAELREGYTLPSYPAAGGRQGPGTYPGPFVVVNPTTTLAVGWSGQGTGTITLACTTNGGPSWQDHEVPPLAGGVASNLGLASVDGTHAWIVYGPAGHEEIVATADGGRTWMVEYP